MPDCDSLPDRRGHELLFLELTLISVGGDCLMHAEWGVPFKRRSMRQSM
jgi:hypothetical protein